MNKQLLFRVSHWCVPGEGADGNCAWNALLWFSGLSVAAFRRKWRAAGLPPTYPANAGPFFYEVIDVAHRLNDDARLYVQHKTALNNSLDVIYHLAAPEYPRNLRVIVGIDKHCFYYSNGVVYDRSEGNSLSQRVNFFVATSGEIDHPDFVLVR